jgi:hypothetical protein
MKRLVYVVLGGLILLFAAGCDSMPIGGGEAPPQYVPPAVPPPPLPGTLPGQPGQQVPTMPVAPAPVPVPMPAGQPSQFVWTETPAFNQIPTTPVSGMANGRPFAAAAVVIEPGTDSWRMIIRDQPLAQPTAVLTGGQSINLDIPGEPATGANWMRPMEYGGGYFQIGNDPQNPQSTTSWNADNAWALEITDWQVADYDSNGPMFQSAGVASGRVAVCYKGSGSIQNSWVAGTFHNAVVRYMGQPYWLKEGADKSSSSGGKSSGGKKKAPSKGGAIGKLPPGTQPPDKQPPPKADPPKKEPPPEKEPPPKDDPPKKDKGKDKDKKKDDSETIKIDLKKLKEKLKKKF